MAKKKLSPEQTEAKKARRKAIARLKAEFRDEAFLTFDEMAEIVLAGCKGDGDTGLEEFTTMFGQRLKNKSAKTKMSIVRTLITFMEC
jgi:hypothetical protein